MTESNDSPPNSPTNRRRPSFAGQTFADLFGTGRARSATTSENSTSGNSPPPGQINNPITSAAAQAQRRRVSVSTLGLAGSPSQTSPFASYRRRDSISSANSGSIDESAIEDDGVASSQAAPTTPFGRRMSFGARALRDVKSSTGGSGGGGGGGTADKGPNGRSSTIPENSPLSKVDAPTTTKGRGLSFPDRLFSFHSIVFRDVIGKLLTLRFIIDGYNWADNFRNRAERSSSINTAGVNPMNTAAHVRAKSVATMQPPAKEMPQPNVPDHFQERILKGDFYMD